MKAMCQLQCYRDVLKPFTHFEKILSYLAWPRTSAPTDYSKYYAASHTSLALGSWSSARSPQS